MGWQVFYGCPLKNVTISENVTSIGPAIFECCWELKSIYCKPIIPPTLNGVLIPSWNEDTLGEPHIPSSLKIYVPTESVKAYKEAWNWKDYASVIEGYNF